ncbi:MAG: DUF2637 domain-containing protein, partial [Nitriliruptorales bacterium]|nr:DUF2637 domain-containing protein [Nitriliruptorales bacterium]
MGPFTMRRFTIWLARAGLLVIAMVTFVTSFDAITATAAATGAVSPRLAWAIPIAIDGLILVGSAVAWTEAIDDDWHPFPLLTVGGAAGLSVWANVAHAAGAPVLGQVLAAVPPIALIVSVELGAWQVRRSFKRVRDEEAAQQAAAAAAAAEAAAEAALRMSTMADDEQTGADDDHDEAALGWKGRELTPEPEREPHAFRRYAPEPEPQRTPQAHAHTAPVRAPVAAQSSASTSVPQNGVARSDATESDGELMQRIAAYVTDVGHRPTQREIAEALGLT